MGIADLAVYYTAMAFGMQWTDAHVLSFISSLMLAVGVGTLRQPAAAAVPSKHAFSVTAVVSAFCALFLRGGLLAELFVAGADAQL